MKLNPVAYTGVLFIVSLSTAALSHKEFASVRTSCDSFCVHGHEKRDTVLCTICAVTNQVVIHNNVVTLAYLVTVLLVRCFGQSPAKIIIFKLIPSIFPKLVL